MRDSLNIDLVFPIRDEVSAWLMCLKAELLYDAGIINDNELNAVIGRAAAAIERSENGGRNSQICDQLGERTPANAAPLAALSSDWIKGSMQGA